MKLVFLLAGLLVLSSCATTKKEYSHERNCSKRTLDWSNKALNFTANNEVLVKEIREIFRSHIDDMKKCWQANLDNGGETGYQFCIAIGVDEKGKWNFLDVDDHTSYVPDSLRNCMMDVLAKMDYSKYPKINIMQPMNAFSKSKP